MRHRPKRENYDIGIYGESKYQEMLERYCTYLENQNSALSSRRSQSDSREDNNKNSVSSAIQVIIDKIDEQIRWQGEEKNPFSVIVITVLQRVRRAAENILESNKSDQMHLK